MIISIIGAGPAGNYAAYLLAKQKHTVNVYEDHSMIGTPVQCTGIITHELTHFVPINKKYLVNTITGAKIYAPNKSSVTVRFRNPDYIVNRTAFDSFIAKMAKREGARYFLNHRFKGNDGKTIDVGEKKVKTDILIGADGPVSAVAKMNGMWCDRKFVTGHQFTIETQCDPTLVEFWLGYGMFGWLVPENDTIARVGVATSNNAQQEIKRFIRDRAPHAKVLSQETGLIPIYNKKQIIQKDFVYLVGDAATQVKATSFGGIVHGLKAAEILAQDIKHYQNQCRKKVGRDLSLSFLMRKMLNRFTTQDYNRLVSLFSQQRLRTVLEQKTRDFPTKFVGELLVKEPRLLQFLPKLLL